MTYQYQPITISRIDDNAVALYQGFYNATALMLEQLNNGMFKLTKYVDDAYCTSMITPAQAERYKSHLDLLLVEPATVLL